MIVVADGDIGRNTVRPDGQSVEILGYNRFDRKVYGNKDFLLNSIEYLLDEQGVLDARSKEVKLRLLDRVKAKDERVYWQMVNLVGPLVFLLVFATLFMWMRKRKYARDQS